MSKNAVLFVASVAAFAAAARQKVRFETSKGDLALEDLYDLPLTSMTGKVNLDGIAKGLAQELKEAETQTSFVDPSDTGASAETQLKFDLVRHVISEKVEERNAARDAQERKEKKQKLLELIAKKKDQELEGKSLEELTAMVSEL